MTLTLGIDPGSRDGAAVVLSSDGRRMMDWVAWWTLRRKSGRVVVVDGFARPRQVSACPLAVPRELRRMADAHGAMHVVVEELMMISGGRMQPRTLVPLAEAAGQAIGAVAARAVSMRRVLATEWRPTVLGLPRRYDARRAEEAAMDRVPRVVESGHWEDIAQLPRRAHGAVCEAACIARWGVVTCEG